MLGHSKFPLIRHTAALAAPAARATLAAFDALTAANAAAFAATDTPSDPVYMVNRQG